MVKKKKETRSEAEERLRQEAVERNEKYELEVKEHKERQERERKAEHEARHVTWQTYITNRDKAATTIDEVLWNLPEKCPVLDVMEEVIRNHPHLRKYELVDKTAKSSMSATPFAHFPFYMGR